MLKPAVRTAQESGFVRFVFRICLRLQTERLYKPGSQFSRRLDGKVADAFRRLHVS